MSFSERVHDIAMQRVQQGKPVIIPDIVREARDRYPQDFTADGERLADLAARRELKSMLRRMSEDDGTGQLSLPGIDLPTLIALPVDGEDFIYKRSVDCTFDELERGRLVRARNVTAAQEKLDHYDEQLDVLRPQMAGTVLTVREVLA